MNFLLFHTQICVFEHLLINIVEINIVVFGSLSSEVTNTSPLTYLLKTIRVYCLMFSYVFHLITECVLYLLRVLIRLAFFYIKKSLTCDIRYIHFKILWLIRCHNLLSSHQRTPESPYPSSLFFPHNGCLYSFEYYV